jgi:hypothetical protein
MEEDFAARPRSMDSLEPGIIPGLSAVSIMEA